MSIDVDVSLYLPVNGLGAALRTLAGFCRSPEWPSRAECRIELENEEPIFIPHSGEDPCLNDDVAAGQTVRVQRDEKNHRLSIIWLAEATPLLMEVAYDDIIQGNLVLLYYDVSIRCGMNYARLHIGTGDSTAGISLAADHNDEESERQASLGVLAIFEAGGGVFGTKMVNSEIYDVLSVGHPRLDAAAVAAIAQEVSPYEQLDRFVETVLEQMR